MENNYTKIAKANLDKLYLNIPKDISKYLSAYQESDRFFFRAFGENCVIEPGKIILGKNGYPPVIGILISLYALTAKADDLILTPFKSFKEVPNSMPYIGAFKTHTEDILIPHVSAIEGRISKIVEKLDGQVMDGREGDFSFIVKPLPKIALKYICYMADEDFSASVTCLYSNNAHLFLPVDALADVGEYTSKIIINLLDSEK